MEKRRKSHLSVNIILAICLLSLLLSSTSFYANKHRDPKKVTNEKETSLKEDSSWLKNQPVEFLENKGQIMNTENKPATNVLFKAEAPGIDLYVTKSGLSYVFLTYEKRQKSKKEKDRENRAGLDEDEEMTMKYEKIDLDLLGATIKAENILKEDTGIAYYNFMYAADGKPLYHVKKYRKLTVQNVYPGIDWVLYNASGKGFKYDFIVHAGADAKQITLIYRSAKKIMADETGNLHLESLHGNIEEKAPVSYLLESGKKIESRFELISQEKKSGLYESKIGIVCSTTNTSQTLVIDPVLLWSTFYGGSSFEGTYAIDTDPSGNVFLCGYLASTNFPLLSMGTFFQSTPATPSGFILKFTNSGTLLWSTFFGPANVSYLTTDINGNVFICGLTNSTVFPTVNASTYFQPNLSGPSDAYIAKFDVAGNCVWSTLYGGSGSESASCITSDKSGNVFLLGTTTSSTFPLQNSGGYFEATLSGVNSGFVVKFDNAGNRLWATYIKGLNVGLGCTDANNDLYLTGQTNTLIPLANAGGTSFYQGSIMGNTDVVLMKFNATDQLVWGTYYGGATIERGTSLSCDKAGNLFVCGVTNSTDFPIQNAGSGSYFQSTITGTGSDAFILKFDNTLTRAWASYVGGSRNDFHLENDNLTIDTCGNVFLGFTTQSRNLPFQQACDGGMFDNSLDTSISIVNDAVYLARFSNNGNLMWSSYFCGDGRSFRTTLDADRFGNVFFSGEWNGVTNPATYPLVYPPSPTYTQSFSGYEDLYIAKFTNNLAIQQFSYSPFCTGDANPSPTLAPGFLTGGTFSSTSGLSISATNGQITVSLSTPGTYTVNYIMAPCYCPGASASIIGTATITLLATPTLSIAGKTAMCLKENRTFTVSGGTTYTWNTGSHSSTINASPTTTATLIYTVSSQAANGCVAKKTLSITVSKCTGLEDFEMGAVKLNMYPNPNSGQFTISSDRDIDLEITNELGQFVQRIQLSDKNERRVEVQGLASGIYFINDKHSNEKTNYKIVVTN